MIRYLLWILISVMIASCGGSSPPNPNDQNGNGENGPPPYPGIAPNGTIQGEANFAKLIRSFSQGKTQRTPWAGYWWPYSENGILDAALRYDRVRGNRTASSWEVAQHGSELRGLQSWFGHCNGWAAAAVLYPEPTSPKSTQNTEFSVADQKALLSELAMEVRADFFGTRSDGAEDSSSASFKDTYPDVFFLVLTNYLGKGLPMILDRYTGVQVWNQPLAGYRIDPIRPEDSLGTDPSAPNVHRIRVTTTIWWLRDDVDGGALTEPFEFKDGPSYESRVLRYEVWLDGPPVFDGSGQIQSSGKVIVARQGNVALGGAWLNSGLSSVNSHPDYLWVPYAVTPSTGYSNPGIEAAWIHAHIASPWSGLTSQEP